MSELKNSMFIESAFTAPFYNKEMIESLKSAVEWLELQRDFENKNMTVNFLTSLETLNRKLSKKNEFLYEKEQVKDELSIFSPKAGFCGLEYVVYGKYLYDYKETQFLLDILRRIFSRFYGKNQFNENGKKYRFIFEVFDELYGENWLMYELLLKE